MTPDDHNPLGPLRNLDVGPAPTPHQIERRVRRRTRRRQLAVAGAAVLAAAGLATTLDLGADNATVPDVATNPPTSISAPATTSPAADGSALDCGPMPVFASEGLFGEPLRPDQFSGTPGPAPGSRPGAEGQVVAHWLGDFDLAVELRWPGDPIPDGASTVEITGNAHYPAVISRDPIDDRVLANLILSDDEGDPCRILAIEFSGPNLDPVLDVGWGLVGLLRPIDDLPAAEAAFDRANAQAQPDTDRPDGRCAEPIEVAGAPSSAQLLELVDRFIADRLAGAAAELCLTEPGRASFFASQASPLGVPALCLFECENASMTAAAPQLDRSGTWPEALVDYTTFTNRVLKLRESYSVDVTDDGLLLITSVSISVDSWIPEPRARRILSTLLDALAAQEWDTAAATLINEGAISDPRLGGDDWYSRPYDEVFAGLCATALCDAPYTIGPTVGARESQRTMAVTFETTTGPLTVPMSVDSWEGVANAGTLPPDGDAADPLPPLDIQLFAEPYDRDLLALRYSSVERVRDRASTWTTSWRYRNLPDQFAVAGGDVVFNSWNDDLAQVVDESAGEFLPVGNPGGRLLGASDVGGRSLVFLGERDGTVHAHDLDSGEQVTLLCEHCTAPFSDERVWFVDAGNNRIAFGEVVGDSYTTSIYAWDPATLTLGAELGDIAATQQTGHLHLAPDGDTAVARIFDVWREPAKTIAVFDTASGEIIGSWTLDGAAEVITLDYDGRWIVAQLSDATTWVIDAGTPDPGANGFVDQAGRIVDVAIQIRFS